MKIDKDVTVAVTGGASGLGLATATAFAAAGADVTLFDRDADALAQRAAEIGAAAAMLDVTDETAVATAMSEIRKRRGALHVLVNCAGIAPAAKTLARGAPHQGALFRKVVDVNLTGSFNCAVQAAAIMAENTPVTEDGERGVIIHTASVAAFEGQIGQIAYAASKGAIAAMTLPMARDLADHGIRVCAIAPGIFRTPMLAGLPEEVQDSLGAQVPFPRRLGDPGEFAALALHIAQNGMLNGTVIRLDGAIRMAPR